MRRPRGSTRVERRGASGGAQAEVQRRRFADRARQARTVRWRPLLAVLAAVALVAGVVYLVWFSPVLVVKKVEVEGVSGAQAEAVRTAAAVPVGVPLANVDLAAPGGRVTRSPLYDEVTVARKWPSTVVVRVRPRTPVLALRRSGGVQLVDAKGVAYVSAAEAPKGVPTVGGTGEVSPQGLRAAISVMQALPPELRTKVSAMTVEGPSMVTFQLGSIKVLWGDESEPQLKVKVLQALIPKAKVSVNVSAPGSPAVT